MAAVGEVEESAVEEEKEEPEVEVEVEDNNGDGDEGSLLLLLLCSLNSEVVAVSAASRCCTFLPSSPIVSTKETEPRTAT